LRKGAVGTPDNGGVNVISYQILATLANGTIFSLFEKKLEVV
jgi:hypothetical protein